MNERFDEKIRTAVELAWRQGSPVAGRSPTARAEVAAVAVHRWRSAHRRVSPNAELTDRIEDLAKGLRDGLEQNPAVSGPLIEDYRWLAYQIVVALTAASAESTELPPGWTPDRIKSMGVAEVSMARKRRRAQRRYCPGGCEARDRPLSECHGWT